MSTADAAEPVKVRPAGPADLETLVGLVHGYFDLYVRPDHRRGGVGTALFQACLALVREGDFSHMEWVTAPENRAARSFYGRMGAAPTDWVVFEL